MTFPRRLVAQNEVSCGLPRVSQRTPLGDFRGLATNELTFPGNVRFVYTYSQAEVGFVEPRVTGVRVTYSRCTSESYVFGGKPIFTVQKITDC